MLSRQEGRNYLILLDGERFPVKINKNKLDRTLGALEKALQAIQKEIGDAYDTNYELYSILQNVVFGYYGLAADRVVDGKNEWVEDTLYSLKEIKEQLATGNDTIMAAEYVTTLRDIGYQKTYGRQGQSWEKTIVDNDDVEIVEEIYIGDEILHRKRTTVWQKTDYGKASTEIIYKNLPISKKLAQIIENTTQSKE